MAFAGNNAFFASIGPVNVLCTLNLKMYIEPWANLQKCRDAKLEALGDTDIGHKVVRPQLILLKSKLRPFLHLTV